MFLFVLREQVSSAFPPKRLSPPDLVHKPKALFKLWYSYAEPFDIIISSTDSGLEAFSHNPTDDSFASLPDRTDANTKYLNERFLSY
jgi:hypothetical protein